jgi:hypothetical protein
MKAKNPESSGTGSQQPRVRFETGAATNGGWRNRPLSQLPGAKSNFQPGPQPIVLRQLQNIASHPSVAG